MLDVMGRDCTDDGLATAAEAMATMHGCDSLAVVTRRHDDDDGRSR